MILRSSNESVSYDYNFKLHHEGDFCVRTVSFDRILFNWRPKLFLSSEGIKPSED